MIIKVCGLKDKIQIEKLDQIESVNWLGSIFYEKSKRFVNSISGDVKSSKKVGVFVNEKMVRIIEIANSNKVDILQLHGNETPEYCLNLKEKYTIVKAFGIDDFFDFNVLIEYENKVDYFLFDTKTIEHGGSGRVFNWEILENYTMNIPFLLSGGIHPNSIEAIKEFRHPLFAGIDLNSGFENEPGDKNIELLETFISEIIKK